MQPIIIQSLSEIENAVLLVLFYTYHLVDNNIILGFERRSKFSAQKQKSQNQKAQGISNNLLSCDFYFN